MIKMCHEKQDWEKLNSTLTVISKRRGQSKVAIQAIVDEAIKYLDTTPNEATKVALLTTLKDICEGQKPLQWPILWDEIILNSAYSLDHLCRQDLCGSWKCEASFSIV